MKSLVSCLLAGVFVVGLGACGSVDDAEGDIEQTEDAELGAKGGKKGKCGYNDPNKVWVAKSAEQCMVVKFFCEEGSPFFNSCGCGCDLTAPVQCGASTCGTGEYCCNESCGICAPEGGFCTQQVCSPI